MNLEEIEDRYKTGIERAEADFISAVSKGFELKEAELIYRKATLKIRKDYTNTLLKFLNLEKNKRKTNNNFGKNNNYARFKVESSDNRLNFWNRLSIKINVLHFKASILIHKCFKSIIPNSILLLYYHFKFRLIKISRRLGERINNFLTNFLEPFYFARDELKKFLSSNHNKS